MSATQDRRQYNIGAHGVPREYTACPGCGRQYGHHKTQVCVKCDECAKCCRCEKPELKPAAWAVGRMLENL